MENEAQACEPIDPLAAYRGLSLFPQTLCALPDPSIPYDPDEDLQSIHNHLRSTVLQNPSKFLNEAKSIVDGDMNLPIYENQAYHPSYEEREYFQENAQENNRERRPGLDRKRARFSLKPNSSHPVKGLEQNLGIGELKDPVTFFTAYEQIDNAKREIKKQMGGVSFDSNPHRATRQRRPGILGKNQRRQSKYKHLYSLEASGDEIVSSQEIVELNSLSPLDQVSQGTSAHVSSHEEEQESTDSFAVRESKLDQILGELLHQNFDGPDDDLAFNILQEKLQLKPIVVDKLSLPDLPDDRMFNMKSFGRGDASRPRKALVDIENTLNGMFHESFTNPRLIDDNSLNNLASPTPPKSPFALLSLLQKRKSKSKASVDPFSILDADHVSSGNSSSAEKSNKKSDIIGSGYLFGSSDKLNSPVIDEGVAPQDLNFIEGTGGEFAKPSEKLVEHNICEPEASINVAPSRSDANMKQNFGGLIKDDVVTDGGFPINVDVDPSTSNISMEENFRGRDTNEVLDSGEDPINAEDDMLTVHGEKSVGGHHREDELCTEDTHDQSKKCHASDEKASLPFILHNVEKSVGGRHRENELCTEVAPDQSKKCHASDEKDKAIKEAGDSASPYCLDPNLGEPQDQSSVDEVEVQRIDECMNPEDSVQEQHVEVTEQVLEITIEEQMKPKVHPRGKRRKTEISGRQSLAGAGTYLKAGLRRSTRMRTRPLEYWKGEKLVYGRIHSSLPTVIGMKYASPAKTEGGEPILKVKSFVSDEYKELLERASYY